MVNSSLVRSGRPIFPIKISFFPNFPPSPLPQLHPKIPNSSNPYLFLPQNSSSPLTLPFFPDHLRSSLSPSATIHLILHLFFSFSYFLFPHSLPYHPSATTFFSFICLVLLLPHHRQQVPPFFFSHFSILPLLLFAFFPVFFSHAHT